MIKILPPRKGSGKSSVESKKASSKTPDQDPQFTVSGNKNAKASSAAPASEPAAAAPNSFSVKAPKAPQKNAPRPSTSESKTTQSSSTVSPPKQKVSAKVKVTAAIQEDVVAEPSSAQKSSVPPPKKKSQGKAKAKVVAAPELSVEDAYDYEL
jgi:hypothetical protein